MSSTAAATSPVGVLELDTHSSSKADTSESSLPHVPRYVSPTPHDAMLAGWRSRVKSQSSSPTTSTCKIPTAPIPPASSIDIISPVDASPGVHQQQAILIQPRQDIPIDHSQADHTSGHSTSDQSLSRLSSTSLSLGMRPGLWLQSPMSSTRFSSTIKSSNSDSPTTTSDRHSHSPSHSAGPSRKRCRSPATIVPSSIPASGALVPTHADLLLPHKRFRDSISPKDSVEEDINADMLADIKADVAAVEVVADMDIEAEVDAGIGIEVVVRVDIEDEDKGESKSSDRGTIEVEVDVVSRIDIPDSMLMPDVRFEDIKSGQRELEARSLISGGERAGFLDHVVDLERSNARLRGTLMMAIVRVDRFWLRMSFMAGELRQIHRFRNYDWMRFRRLETLAMRHVGFLP
ncbi:hypothetical protein Tco_0327207 [Tanacetum coccineum]